VNSKGQTRRQTYFWRTGRTTRHCVYTNLDIGRRWCIRPKARLGDPRDRNSPSRTRQYMPLSLADCTSAGTRKQSCHTRSPPTHSVNAKTPVKRRSLLPTTVCYLTLWPLPLTRRVCMKVQLTVVGIWVHFESMSSGNCNDVSTIDEEEDRTKHASLRDAAGQWLEYNSISSTLRIRR